VIGPLAVTTAALLLSANLAMAGQDLATTQNPATGQGAAGGDAVVTATAGASTALQTAPGTTGDQAPAVAPRAASPAVRVNGTLYRPAGEVPRPPRVRARTWVVVDMASGNVLGKHRARTELPQASTIKLLTALTATHRVHPTAPLRATRRAANTICSCAGVRAGRRYTRSMLLAGMLIPSGNDAAEALAGADPRGRARFIRAMNNTAARLGASDTVARNPSGLDQPGGRSSARDLMVFLRAAAAHSAVAGWLDRPRVQFGPIGGRTHRLVASTDYLHLYDGSYAAKNGYTTRAGNTLAVATRIAGREIGVALLDARSGYTTSSARRLTVWAARNAGLLAPVGHLPGLPGTP
jgi:serine-type D-Ala-D-Ala carboxypeptidase (penicillin-binding protein 5/6)